MPGPRAEEVAGAQEVYGSPAALRPPHLLLLLVASKWERELDRIWSSEFGRPGESRDRESDQREQGQKRGWECINIPASDESSRIGRGHTQVSRRRP